MADADPSMLTLGEIDPGTAVLLATFLRPVLSIGSLLMILRIVMTWFPEVKDKEMPWLLAYLPTEPVLGPTRKVCSHPMSKHRSQSFEPPCDMVIVEAIGMINRQSKLTP